MTLLPTSCPACGAQLANQARFCGKCGHALGPASVPAQAVPAQAVPAQAVPAEAAPAQAVPAQAVPPEAAPPSPRPAQRTMLGLSAPVLGGGEVLGPPTPAQPPAGATNRTMLGMPMPSLAGVQQQVAAGGSPPSSPAESVPPTTGAAGRPLPQAVTNRTMLGMAAPVGSLPPAAAGTDQQPDPWGGERALGSLPPHADNGAISPATGRGGRAYLVVAALALLVFLVGGGGVAAWFLWGKEAEVRVAVVQTDAGEGLQITVPRARSGDRVRFGEQEAELDGGQAVFQLSADDLHIGDNELLVAVVRAKGKVETHALTLALRYRVRTELAALAADPPGIDVVIDALVGTTVELDGQPVVLDDRGHGVRRIPIEPPTAANAPADAAADGDAPFTLSLPYRITLADGGDGTAVENGTVQTRIPFAALQIDRPGARVVTDHASVEIAGAVHPSATVTIDGTVVPVNEGRFLHRYAADRIQRYQVRILARQPGRVPRLRLVEIQRVGDLAAEAQGFAADPSLTYARIAQNPAIYRGQRVAIVGRVYNVEVSGGQSVLQVLARDCPRGQRCSVWVTYPAATDLTVETWVRVLGTVAGEQQFRSENDRVVSVPKVEAAFLLPAEP